LVEAVPALQGTRLPLRPPGDAGDASPLLCTGSPRLRPGRTTRYGWVARPYPTGTCTLQEMPNFSWRDNTGPQVPPIAAARDERRLLAVACRPMLGQDGPEDGRLLVPALGSPTCLQRLVLCRRVTPSVTEESVLWHRPPTTPECSQERVSVSGP